MSLGPIWVPARELVVSSRWLSLVLGLARLVATLVCIRRGSTILVVRVLALRVGLLVVAIVRRELSVSLKGIVSIP